MKIGKLKDRITIMKNETTKDNQGGRISNWAEETKVWAQVSVPKAARQAIQGGYVSELTYEVLIREYDGRLVGKRIIYKDKTLEILHAYDNAFNGTTIQAQEKVGRR